MATQESRKKEKASDKKGENAGKKAAPAAGLKRYEVTGHIVGAKPFRKEVSGRSERHARDVALSLFGSTGGFKRSQIKISGIKAVE